MASQFHLVINPHRLASPSSPPWLLRRSSDNGAYYYGSCTREPFLDRPPTRQASIRSQEDAIPWSHRRVVAGAGRAASGSPNRRSRILISTGDVMGDVHGAALVRALIAAAGEDIEVYAVGGKRMQDAGAVLIGGWCVNPLPSVLDCCIPPLVPIRRTSVMGSNRPPVNHSRLCHSRFQNPGFACIESPVVQGGIWTQKFGKSFDAGDNTGLSSIGLLEALPLIIPSIEIQLRARNFLKNHPPDLVVLIDYPGINIPFGKYAKKKFGCKVVYFIPPNEWLWNTSRTGAIIDSCDAILSVYPGETDYFRKLGGHVVEAREALGFIDKDIVILLMPASRAQELRHVWPVIAAAAKLLLKRILALKSHHDVHFIVPSVLPSGDQLIKQGFEEFGLAGYASLWQGDAQGLMPAADLAITKSGSVNLELALHHVPQVVVYKLDKATAWIARNIFQFRLKYISLVNLILEEQVVPEFIQDDAEPMNVANAAFDLLPLSDTRVSHLDDGYSKLLPLLGKPGVVKRAAVYILESLKF